MGRLQVKKHGKVNKVWWEFEDLRSLAPNHLRSGRVILWASKPDRAGWRASKRQRYFAGQELVHTQLLLVNGWKPGLGTGAQNGLKMVKHGKSPCLAGFVRKRIIKFKTDFEIPIERPNVHNITLPPPFSPAVQPSVQTIQRTKRRLRLASSCQHFANRKAKWGVSKDEEPAFEEPAFHHPKTLTNIEGTDWGKITYKACHRRNAKVGGCQTQNPGGLAFTPIAGWCGRSSPQSNGP